MFITMQYLQEIAKQFVIQNILFFILPNNLRLASIFQAIIL